MGHILSNTNCVAEKSECGKDQLSLPSFDQSEDMNFLTYETKHHTMHEVAFC